MSYILHLGHQPSDIGVDPTAVVTTTGQGYFDETLDNNCIRLQTGLSESPSTLSFDWPVAVSDTTWVGFRAKLNNYNYYDNKDYLTFSNSSETLAKIRRDSNDFTEIIVYGDTTETFTTSNIWPFAYTQWHDIKITVNANITCEFYIDGSSIGSVTAANTGGKSKPTSCFLTVGFWDSTASSDEFYFAHLAVLDNVSTINRRFIRQRPNTAGTDTGFAGSVSALADGLPSTVMSSDTAGQRQSFSITGPTIPASAFNAVHIVSNATQPVTGGTAPTQLSGYLKIGGTNYDVTAETVTTNQIVSTWDVDPSTTNGWDNTNLPTEFGLLSST